MSESRRIWKLIAAALAFSTIISTAAAVYYYQEYASLKQRYSSIREKVIQISITIDYENGTSETFRDIYAAQNASVLEALKSVATVHATYWPSFDAFLVDAINGVANNVDNNGRWWEYWVNDKVALASADKYILQDGDNMTWKYQQF